MSSSRDKIKDALDPLSSVLHEHAEVVLTETGEHHALSATEVLAWRGWFNRRRSELTSSGGRPTNPRWTLRRQVPFSPETWEELEERAQICGRSGQKIAPGQLAAFILEESIGVTGGPPRGVSVAQRPNLGEKGNGEIESDDPELEGWKMPELFAGCAA